MTSINASFRTARPQQLAEELQAARNYTLGLFDCLAGHGLDVLARVPHIATINPPLWELGHIGWFQEYWIARNPARGQGWRADPELRGRMARAFRQSVAQELAFFRMPEQLGEPVCPG